jgi:farnesyl-diphosphate farnesyltransferase
MSSLDELLERTSRTFAVAIPFLPDPLRGEVTTAYLLLRIADTFEDATRWSRAERLSALERFAECVATRNVRAAEDVLPQWLANPPCEHAGYLELLQKTPAVLESVARVSPDRRDIVVRHALRAIKGMADFVGRGTERGELRLRDLPDLQQYCYVVAGIVGELLTDLFLDTWPSLNAARATLENHARAFGEGLQLVNILKDATDDTRDGRYYLPPAVARSAVFDLARRNLQSAATYVLAMQSAGTPRGLVAFLAFPVLLARESLDRTQRIGAGAKVGRDVVAALLSNLNGALDAGQPALSV